MNIGIRVLIGMLAGTSVGSLSLFAQLEAPHPKPILGARMPALSPDAKILAFVYKGDIWRVSAEGGHATPLTTHVEYDAHPLFSPDGKWIAFASKRCGNWDLFVMPADGGQPRQLTWHSGSDIPTGWSPDSHKILFSAKRDSANNQLFAVDVATLATTELTQDYATINSATYSPDGGKVAYGRYGFPNWRPRYHGSAAAQIWLLNLTDGSRQPVTHNERQHLWAQFLPGGKQLLAVTYGQETPNAGTLQQPLTNLVDSPLRTPNLWTIDFDGKGKQVTQFTGSAVRSPSVAFKTGAIAFEYAQDLYLMKGLNSKPAKLQIFANADDKQTVRRLEKLTAGAGEAEPSPDGRHLAFGLRGDIWTILVDKPKGLAGRSAEFARRLTDWAGDDADFMWSTNGKTLYFLSDREMNVRLYEMDVETLKVTPLWNRTEDVANPVPAPSGKQMAFWVTGPEGGLHVMDLKSKETKRIVRLPGPHMHGYGGGEFAWSPDSQWIAYSARSASRSHNIFVVKTEGGEPQNITQLAASHGQPVWSPDGKYLFFQSSRAGDAVYQLPLKREDALASETEPKYEKPKDAVKVEIDFTDISQRIRKFAAQAPQSSMVMSAEGLLLFLSEGDVWSVTYDGKETKRITTGGGKSQLRVLPDGKKAFFVQGSELYQLKIAEGKIDKITFTADWDRDVQVERKAAFAQLWRTYHRAFYDGNFHGRNWEELRRRYEPLLDAADTTDELAGIIQLMIGELEASHSEVRVPENNSVSTPQLGFAFDYSYHGPGLKIASVPERAPGAYKQTHLNTGEIVLEINSQPVSLDETLYQTLNRYQGRELELLVNATPEKKGARKVRYKALTAEEWSDLHYKNRIQRLRKLVEEKSGNKIGYVHISAMGGSNQTQFEQEVYEYISGKQAMIIDVRFNRGGNISDTLIDWLERKQHGWARGRDSEPDKAPVRAWEKQVVVLLNEHSYSNGEMFPYAMHQRELAKLVGTPSPGYVIWTYDFPLINGLNARLPLAGVYRLDGSNMENNGQKPDEFVPLSPDDWLADRDPQLDKAIDLLLRPQ